MLVDRAAASTTAVFLYWDESFSFYLQGKEVSTKSKGGKRTWSTSPHFPLLQETAYEIYSMSNCPCLFFIKKKILWIDECKVFFSIFWPDTIMTGAPSSGSFSLARSKCLLKMRTLSVQFSGSIVSDSLPPHESQHARPPCPSPTPGVHSDSHPLSQWCHPAISSFAIPFSTCPQSLPAK